MGGLVVVTGANRGIGLALVDVYLAKGYQVVAACRTASDALKSSKAEVIEGLDIGQAETIAILRDQLVGRKVDILINNAGILRDEVLGRINYDTIIEQFNINAVGALRVTESLLGNLESGSKVALVTSRMGSIADNGSGGRYGYRMSKAAMNASGMSLAVDLKPKGVAVAILHPGYVQTDMVGNRGDIPAETAAGRFYQRIDELNIENSGTFWHSSGEVLPW